MFAPPNASTQTHSPKAMAPVCVLGRGYHAELRGLVRLVLCASRKARRSGGLEDSA